MQLRIVDEKGQERIETLNRLVTTIGIGDHVDIQLGPSEQAQRFGMFIRQDAGYRFKTLIHDPPIRKNGRPLKKLEELKKGEVLIMDTWRVFIEDGSEQPKPQAPRPPAQERFDPSIVLSEFPQALKAYQQHTESTLQSPSPTPPPSPQAEPEPLLQSPEPTTQIEKALFSLSPLRVYLHRLHAEVLKQTLDLLPDLHENDELARKTLHQQIEEVIELNRQSEEWPRDLQLEDAVKVIESCFRGLGPLKILFEVKECEEVRVRHFDYLEADFGHGWQKVDSPFISQEHLDHCLKWIIKGIEQPKRQRFWGEVYFKQYRLHYIQPPLASSTSLSIKKLSPTAKTFESLIQNQFCSEEMAEFLKLIVEQKIGLLICGAPATGRTSLLSALAQSLPEQPLAFFQKRPEVECSTALNLNLGGIPSKKDFPALIEELETHRVSTLLGDDLGSTLGWTFLKALCSSKLASIQVIPSQENRETLRDLTLFCQKESPDHFKSTGEALVHQWPLLAELERAPEGHRHIKAIYEMSFVDNQLRTREIFKVTDKGFERSGAIPGFIQAMMNSGTSLPFSRFREIEA